MGKLDKTEKYTVAGLCFGAVGVFFCDIQAEFARRRAERERRRAERENRGWRHRGAPERVPFGMCLI